MVTLAALYPGQGSQRVGMGRDLLADHPDLVGPIFATANERLGFDLVKVCAEGPEEELRRTDVTQPAVFLISYALHQLLHQSIPAPRIVAGHSLGEYTALVAAGALEWTDALALVRRRGELMAGVSTATPGTMLAVIGVDVGVVGQACELARERTGELIEIANYNSDTQTVVSGTVAGAGGVRQALGEAVTPEYMRIVELEVGAPFHSSLMSAVKEDFAVELERTAFVDPQVPIVANVSAELVTTSEQIRAALKEQLSGAVRWRESMATMVAQGVDTFVEIGPGRALTGLCRDVYPDLHVFSASDSRRAARVSAHMPS